MLRQAQQPVYEAPIGGDFAGSLTVSHQPTALWTSSHSYSSPSSFNYGLIIYVWKRESSF